MSEATHRAGYAAVIGRPNVGKSTLVNALVGEKLAPTSPVPQTTRRRLLGIFSRDDAQVVFVDTPGIHQAVHSLGRKMNEAADLALDDAEVVLCVVDCTRPPGDEDALVVQRAIGCPAPKLLVVNKIDAPRAVPRPEAYAGELQPAAVHLISATRGDGLADLLEDVVSRLPISPPFYPPDQIADAYEREIGGELIREAVLRCTGQEVPHAVAVKVQEWQQRDNGLTYIAANLYVERESQKGIVIGRAGQMLRKIGSLAREQLEGWLQGRVYLDLHVKVMKNWRKDEQALRRLGFYDQR